ncbi:unnamed protein product [Diplocarpon coronariae]
MSRTSLVVAGEAAVDLRRAGRDESSQGRGDAALCGWWPLPAAAGRSGRAPIPKTRNLVSGLPARGALRPVGIYLSLAMLCNDADRISTNDGFGLRTRGSGNLVQPRTAFPAPPQSHGGLARELDWILLPDDTVGAGRMLRSTPSTGQLADRATGKPRATDHEQTPCPESGTSRTTARAGSRQGRGAERGPNPRALVIRKASAAAQLQVSFSAREGDGSNTSSAQERNLRETLPRSLDTSIDPPDAPSTLTPQLFSPACFKRGPSSPLKQRADGRQHGARRISWASQCLRSRHARHRGTRTHATPARSATDGRARAGPLAAMPARLRGRDPVRCEEPSGDSGPWRSGWPLSSAGDEPSVPAG